MKITRKISYNNGDIEDMMKEVLRKDAEAIIGVPADDEEWYVKWSAYSGGEAKIIKKPLPEPEPTPEVPASPPDPLTSDAPF